MALQLTQEELQKLYEEGKTCVWAYKDRYQIDYSAAQKAFILLKVGRFHGTSESITKRKEFIAVTPQQGYKMEEEAYKRDAILF